LVLAKGGVISGTVTNAKGDPIIGIGVRVRMARDESGRSFGFSGRYYDNFTDDRGAYRVYGLPAGTYVVSADGSLEERSSIRLSPNGFATDLPTYAPSSNRENADEFSVRVGEEVSNVNIRYRGERGSTISGILNGLTADNRGFSVTLTSIVEAGPRWYNTFRANLVMSSRSKQSRTATITWSPLQMGTIALADNPNPSICLFGALISKESNSLPLRSLRLTVAWFSKH
jgi:hypothetical protein